jgi:hypothetical protein
MPHWLTALIVIFLAWASATLGRALFELGFN